MSVLAIDVGNSEIGLGLREADGWRARWRLRTSARRTADEYAALLGGLFELDGVPPGSVTAVALASVVPAVTPLVAGMTRALFGREPFVVAPGVRTGMAVRYDPPAALGADRLLDAVAARDQHGAPSIVVDFGTATTFTVVDPAGDLVGGAIAPGVTVAAEALAQSGARLRRIELVLPEGMPVVGRTTEHSMRSGILYGYAGLVAGLLERMDAEMGGSARPTIVATGGMARVLAPMVPRIDHVQPDLTLEGLLLIHAMNET